jgi:hypothetical protein
MTEELPKAQQKLVVFRRRYAPLRALEADEKSKSTNNLAPRIIADYLVKRFKLEHPND